MLVGVLLDVLLIQMVSWCIDRASVCLMVMINAHSLVLDGLEDERNGHFVALRTGGMCSIRLRTALRLLRILCMTAQCFDHILWAR